MRSSPSPLSYIQSIPPYPPGRPIAAVAREFGLDPGAIVKLASNENPLGASPAAIAAVEQAAQTIHRYPDFDSFDLYAALSRQLGLAPAHIALGCGSSELIQLVVRAFVSKDDTVLMPQYSFASYEAAARAVGAKVVTKSLKDWQPDLDALLAAIDSRTRVIFLASPNNPTGALIPAAALEKFADALPDDVVFVLDEAYRDFVPISARPDTESMVRRRGNVLALRTFSKIHGLAGLRVGYGFGDPELIGVLRRLLPPFSVNAMAQAGALAALADEAFVSRSMALNREERHRLEATLRTRGFECVTSHANFVFFDVGDGPAVFQALMRRGVIVRPLANYGLKSWLRVSVGLPEENAVFLDRLGEVLPDGAQSRPR